MLADDQYLGPSLVLCGEVPHPQRTHVGQPEDPSFVNLTIPNAYLAIHSLLVHQNFVARPSSVHQIFNPQLTIFNPQNLAAHNVPTSWEATMRPSKALLLAYLLHGTSSATTTENICISPTKTYTVRVNLFAGELGMSLLGDCTMTRTVGWLREY